MQRLTHSQFLLSAGLFASGLLVVAFVAGFITGTSPTAHLFWNTGDFALGLLATVPMLLVLAVAYLSRSKGMAAIRVFLRDEIGPLLDECRLVDMLLLALLAGLCEESLFRGFLYFWIRDWNPPLAILVSNLLFGVAHAVTPLYAVLAAFIGLYLTALVAADTTPNLLIPITTHTAYDFLAFLVVRWDYRRHCQAVPDEPCT